MTKIILAHEGLEETGVSKGQIDQDLGVSRRTIIRWPQAIEKHAARMPIWIIIIKPGKAPVKSGKQMRSRSVASGHCKKLIIKMWAETPILPARRVRHAGGITTIYKVLSGKCKLRSKWQKNKQCSPIPVAHVARQVIQIGTVLSGMFLLLPSEMVRRYF